MAWNAPTIAILSPPAAANTGGALPTLPMSTAPAAIACSIGGPEVKSDQVTLNGSLLISPAAVSRACDAGARLVADVQGHLGDVGRARWRVGAAAGPGREQPAAIGGRATTAAVARDQRQRRGQGGPAPAGCWCRGASWVIRVPFAAVDAQLGEQAVAQGG